MITTLIIIIAILIVAPLILWSWIKAIKKIHGYQIWFKRTLSLTFLLSYLLALILLVVLIVFFVH